MPSSERLQLTLLLLFLCILLSTPSLFAQVGGQIAQINNSGQSISCVLGQNSMLDPNGNCSISSHASGSFSGNGTSELGEFEALAIGNELIVPWTEFKGLDLENSGDSYNGGPCSGGDLVADGMSTGSFAYYTVFENTGNQYIAFRFRAAQNANSDYGFNILLSNDGLLGSIGANPDTNYVFGNAGFEREIRFKTPGNSAPSLAIYDVDGLQSIADNQAPIDIFPNNWQIAHSEYNSASCSAAYQASFYTIFLPISALDIPSGMSLNEVAFIVSTVADGKSFFSTSIADIGGLIGFGLNNPCNCDLSQASCGASYSDCMLSCLATKISLNSNFPVEWQSITAEVQSESISIIWDVNQEENNHYFSIERQIGGGVFEEIGRIQGRGTSELPMQYSFTDPFLIHDQLYYRIKQTDFDGVFSYSPMVKVKPNNGQEFGTLINQAATHALRLVWFAPESFDGYISILDLSGREYKREAVSFYAGQSNLHLQYSDLSQGIYLFQVLDPVGYPIFVKKFIWQ